MELNFVELILYFYEKKIKDQELSFYKKLVNKDDFNYLRILEIIFTELINDKKWWNNVYNTLILSPSFNNLIETIIKTVNVRSFAEFKHKNLDQSRQNKSDSQLFEEAVKNEIEKAQKALNDKKLVKEVIDDLTKAYTKFFADEETLKRSGYYDRINSE